MKLLALNSVPFTLLAGPLLWCTLSGTAIAQNADEQLAIHEQRARAAEASQDFATAVHEYKTMVQAVPKNAELESNLGVALYFNHDLLQAADVLRRAEGLKASLYTPHLFLGLAMAQLGRPDAAVGELEKAVALNGADPLAHTWLGYEYTAQSHFENAAGQMQLAAEEKPDDQDVWFALGRCYLELGKKATIELVQAAPDSGRTWQLAGELYEAEGKNGKALNLYIGALERKPNIEGLREKVVALGGVVPATSTARDASQGEDDRLYESVLRYEAKAEEAFEQVSEIDPDSYRAHEVLGDSYAAADRFDDAIREYRLVLERKADLPGIHGDLCNALSRTGQIQKAIKECDAETVASPYSAEAYVKAAGARVLVDDNARAATLLQKAFTLDRPPIAAYKLKARIDAALMQYPAAIEAFTHYLAVETNDASAYFLLARAYKAVGDTVKMNQAIAAYKRTWDAAKGSGEAQRVLETQQEQDALPNETDPKEESPL